MGNATPVESCPTSLGLASRGCSSTCTGFVSLVGFVASQLVGYTYEVVSALRFGCSLGAMVGVAVAVQASRTS